MSGGRLASLLRALRRRIAPAGRTPTGRPTRWRRVEEMFLAALALPENARGDYLNRASAGDAGLRSEVASMLAAHLRPGPLDRVGDARSATAALSPLRPPAGVAHFEGLEKLGEGGMGAVYRARDRRLGRVVALKFLHPHLIGDEQASERFRVEAQAAGALDHPNICTIHEIGETDDGQLYIAMPFYEGKTLKQRCAEGPLPAADAVELAIQVANGLAHAHDRGIVHRDIKPANLLLTADGTLKILDFGIAKLADVTLTQTGMAPGTIAYMSPEQVSGEPVDGRSDLWSLGVVLFELLAGERPFRGGHEQAVLHAILTLEPEPVSVRRPGTPPELARILLRALAKRREDRYATARELARDLEELGTARFPSRSAATRIAGGVPAEGERRRIAVAVANVAEHAELVERLAPGRLEEALRRVEAEARACAERHGGIVNRCSGDAVVLLFGVPVAHEDDALRAIRAAADLHERVGGSGHELVDAGGARVRLQIGVDAGPCIVRHANGPFEEFQLVGAAAPTATLLAARAAPGAIWITAECERLIGPYFVCEARESLPLPARADAAPVFEVVRPTGYQTRLEAAERGGLTEYTGRDEELATLRQLLDCAMEGASRCAIVVGEAGLGKSRLLHEFRHGLDRDRIALLQGRCQSLGGGTAYLPFVEVLRGALRLGDAKAPDTDAESAARAIRALGSELEEFVPLYLHLLALPSERYPLPRHLQGEQFRLVMQDALAALVTVTAGRRPAVLLLEDWHWVDDASDSVVQQLTELVAGYPVLVVVTCRPERMPAWAGAGHPTMLHLRPLAESGSLAVVRSVLRAQRVPSELVTRIHERTGGNPFFLEEICHALVEEGAVRVAGDEVTLAGDPQALQLPDTVQAVIRTRLDRLDQEARSVLRVAAVAGREFTRDLLEHTLVGGGRLANALQTLKAAGLIQQVQVVPEPAYRFKHVLTQEVAYAGLLEHQRKDLHGRVGAAIELLPRERLPEHLDRLAHHFSRAEQWEKAVHYALHSAERANALSQFAEALEMLEQAEAWTARLADGPERARRLSDILLRQERLCETLGLRARQQEIVDRLIALLEPAGDRSALAEAYLRRGDVCTLLRRFDEAEEALQRSLRMRRELDDRVGLRNTLRSLGLLRWHADRNEEALPYMEEALALDRAEGNVEAVVGDLSNLGPVLKALGRYGEARNALEEALRLVETTEAEHAGGARDAGELPLKRSYILQNLANIHRERGDLSLALQYLERAAAGAAAKRLPIQLSYHYTAIAHLQLQSGAIPDAVRYYQEAVELTRKARFAPGLAQSLRFLGEVLQSLGRDGEALPHLREAASLFAQLQDRAAEAGMWARVGQIEERHGPAAEAGAAWSRGLGLARESGDRAGELNALEGLARCARRQEDGPARALAHYREAAALARDLGDGPAEGRLRNTIGILEWERGAYDSALGEYQRALALYEALGDRPSRGLMLNSVGVTLKALGRREEARTCLEQAIAFHREAEQPLLEAHALAALGDLHRESAELSAAERDYRRSLQLRRALGDRRGEGWMLAQLAQLELAQGRADRARDLAGEAAAIAAECGDDALRERCNLPCPA